jgi:DNA-binding XRE family transcriptional regulator
MIGWRVKVAKIKKSDFVNANDMISKLPPERRARIEQRTQQLIAEEMTLRDLRKACELTQVRLAEVLGVGQEHISRLEQRSDMLLSTLTSYVKAMGGDLKLVVDFPDRAPVVIAQLSDVFEGPEAGQHEPARRKRIAAGAP